MIGNTVFNLTVHYKVLSSKLSWLKNWTWAIKELVQNTESWVIKLRLIYSLKLAYLTFINGTLYKEVIAKFISPAVSQNVFVALVSAGIVHSSKNLNPKAFKTSKRQKSKNTSSLSNPIEDTILADPETISAATINTSNQQACAAPIMPWMPT